MNQQSIGDQYFLPFLLVAIWETVWKGIALWKSAQHKQRNWFIALLIINSLGILPLVYIKFFQKKKSASKKS